jgi:predicted DNA-binding protein (MmcQ/YjbR family)
MSSGAERARRIRGIYLSLPDTKETPTWGSPHFRVMDKIFGGFNDEGERTSIGFKLEMEHAAAMAASDPRFTRAAYVGHKGWVSMDVTDVEDWEEVRVLVAESYRLIAPKRSLAKLSGPGGGGAASASSSAKKTPATQASASSSAKKAPVAKASASSSTKKMPAAKASSSSSAKKTPPSRRGR